MIQDVSIPAALAAGIISFLSPCVLPLVPPYLIYLTGATIEHVANDEDLGRSAVMLSALFLCSFLDGVVALGASAVIGGLFARGRAVDVAGIAIILMGLQTSV